MHSQSFGFVPEAILYTTVVKIKRIRYSARFVMRFELWLKAMGKKIPQYFEKTAGKEFAAL